MKNSILFFVTLFFISSGISAQTWNIKQNTFKYANLKAAAVYSDTGQSITCQINIKAKYNDTIWAQISKSGITASRILFTKDSLFILDKINHFYQTYSFNDFSKKTGFNFSFQMVQNLLFNNEILPKETQDKIFTDSLINLSQKRLDYNLTTSASKDSNFIRHINLQKDNVEDKLEIDYTQHSKCNHISFPIIQKIKIPFDLANHLYIILDLKYTKVEFLETPLEFPFSIPSNYVKQN